MHSKNDDRTKPVTFEEAIYPYIDSDVYEQETLDYNKKLQELRQKLDKCDRDCLDWLITNLYNSDMRIARYAYEQGKKAAQHDFDSDTIC